MKLTIFVYFKKLKALENYYIKFCSQGVMPAYLITNNTGQGIVIKERQCSHQFCRYYQCTLTVQTPFKFPIANLTICHNEYVYGKDMTGENSLQITETNIKLVILMLRS